MNNSKSAQSNKVVDEQIKNYQLQSFIDFANFNFIDDEYYLDGRLKKQFASQLEQTPFIYRMCQAVPSYCQKKGETLEVKLSLLSDISEGYLLFMNYAKNGANTELFDPEALEQYELIKRMANGEEGFTDGEPLAIELFNYLVSGK